jgi:hypothetical protein
VSAQRLSRLATRALEPFAGALALLTRRGRPPTDRDEPALERDNAILSALLESAQGLLAFLSHRRTDVRALVLGTWLRLHEAHPTLSMKRFCEAMALSPRTLRHWLRTQPRELSPPRRDAGTADPTSPRTRPPRRARFRFDVVLPETQLAADTTDLCAFGVPLKLLAVQDVGGRDQDLLDAVLVEQTENADLVAKVVARACTELPGAQLLTDQGSPYMAQHTLEKLDALELEHAPQKEGDPIGKATVERAFGTVKTILQPLLDITNDLAARVPALSSPELAQAAATVLVAALLRAYQAGARAARRALAQRGAIEPEQLARAAREQRELARAHERSSRLILARVHETYAMPGAPQTFVNALRRYAPETLLEAEKRFATQVHRDDIRDRKSYFAAIVRKVADERRRTRVREQRLREDDERRERHEREHNAQQAHYHDHPLELLRDALGALADEWLPAARELLLRGRGLGHAWMHKALGRLVELHGPLAARDLASAVVRDFARLHNDRIGPDGVRAVLHAARPIIDAIPTPEHPLDCAARFASAMLPSTGPPARPAPHEPLRS